MGVDVTTPKGMRIDLRNASLLSAKSAIERATLEMTYLIMDTATGERRNKFTDANIHLMAAQAALADIQSEPSDQQG